MSTRTLECYRFATAAQWERCLLAGFDRARAGGLRAIQGFGRVPHRVAGADGDHVTRLGLGAAAQVLWRLEGNGPAEARLYSFDAEQPAGPFEVDPALLGASRWVAGRRWVWAATSPSPLLTRFDAETLGRERSLDVRELAEHYLDAASLAGLSLLDIAGDGRDGVWVLVRAGDKSALLHVDCRACRAGFLKLPCEVAGATQIASVARGAALAVLAGEGHRVGLVATKDAKVLRNLPLAAFGPCLTGVRLTSDGRQRLGLLATSSLETAVNWSLFLLDGNGELIEEAPAARADLPQALVQPPFDVAVSRNAVWFGTEGGLFQLDAGERSTMRESESSLVTPLLVSPESERGRGFLRAELDLTLPKGAVVNVEFATTNDDATAEQAASLLRDPATTGSQKRTALWALLEPAPGASFTLTGPSTAGVPIAAPLFAVDARYLALRVRVVTPPGSVPAPLRELRVLYPNASLAEQLPAIFNDPRTDAAGFLRRLVGVLETTTQGLDQKIARLGAFVDANTAPVGWLDYLARWLDLPWDDALPSVAKRRIVQGAGAILAARGTRAGLRELLAALLGDDATITLTDLTVDHPPLRLGGADCRGSALPALLAGPGPGVPVLGEKTRLGALRLACPATDAGPLRELVPRVRVQILAPREAERALGSLVPRVLGQYLPADVRVSLRWAARSAGEHAALVLDANGPAALGGDSVLGRVVLSGRAGSLGDAGLELGFRLE
jgi:phage tail-like protein